MTDAPYRPDLDPFAPPDTGLDAPDSVRAALRATGPVVRVDAPAGGSAWIVTDPGAARAVLADARFAKDTALAPPDWDQHRAGLEPSAAEQESLTALDGEEHARLRKAHAPLLSAKRVAERAGRVHAIARRLLHAMPTHDVVDVMSDFTIRYPVMVTLDLLGVPIDRLEAAVVACRRMLDPAPGEQAAAVAAIADIGAAGLASPDGLATELRERLGPDTALSDVHYHLFALIFAGQLTTDASLGFLIAAVLDPDEPVDDVEALVRTTLRRDPPAPFTLWRFATEVCEVAGARIPAGAPVLVDVKGVNTHPRNPADLTFGAGPHFCVGAQLALLELRAVATVLREEFPHARLAVERSRLRRVGMGGIQGDRLAELPVTLGRREFVANRG